MATRATFSILAVWVLAAVSAAPSMAQTITLTANVPFEFMVGSKTMPSGAYDLASERASQLLRIRNYDARTAALAPVMVDFLDNRTPVGEYKLVFNHYRDQHFLSEVVSGGTRTMYRLPESAAERELAKTAALGREEIVAVLARR